MQILRQRDVAGLAGPMLEGASRKQWEKWA